MTFHFTTTAHPNLDKQQLYSPVHTCSFNRLLTGDNTRGGRSSHQTQLVNLCHSEPADLQRWSHHTPDTTTRHNGSPTSSCLSLRWHPQKHYPSDRTPRKYRFTPLCSVFFCFLKIISSGYSHTNLFCLFGGLWASVSEFLGDLCM